MPSSPPAGAAFATRLGHKTAVVFVDPRNTSRTCHECGHTDTGNRESQAVFQCQRCGHTAHADINAARNILERAAIMDSNPRASGARTRQSRKGRVNHLQQRERAGIFVRKSEEDAKGTG